MDAVIVKSLERKCYCGLWETDPDHFRKEGIPEGYCGICERCGKPGHTQHFPGPVPYTGAWCDRCVRIVPWTNAGVWIQIGFGALIVGLAAFSLMRAFR